MPESLLAVMLALVLVFGVALGVLRSTRPAANQASPPDVDDNFVPKSERCMLSSGPQSSAGIGGEKCTGVLVSAHDDLQQVLCCRQWQFAQAEVVDDEQRHGG